MTEKKKQKVNLDFLMTRNNKAKSKAKLLKNYW